MYYHKKSERSISQCYPSLSALLTTAATSVKVEKSNSALRQVKADFHSMMGVERLNALLVYILYSLIMNQYVYIQIS